MKSVDIPTKTSVVWASGAAAADVNTSIPTTASPTPGAASYDLGFPPTNFEQIAAGGTPPYGKDANGIIQAITQWLQWAQAGGVGFRYDSAFSTSIGGYPTGAVLQSTTTGKFWISSADDNTTDPDGTSSSNWIAFPDVLIQEQKPNYAVDTGIANQIVITLTPAPTSYTDIVGSPIRVKVAYANSISNPTIKINGLTPVHIVNPDASVLDVGQLIAGGIMEGIPRDDNTFQVNTPHKAFSPTASWPPAGFVMPWPTETPPSGFLECDGSTLLISSYPNLYAVLGTRYGGDGVNNFKLPDYRGMFLRGWDHGRGLDPNAATRTNAGGGVTGDHVGTNQAFGMGGASVDVELASPLFSFGYGGWTLTDQEILIGTQNVPYENWGPPTTNFVHNETATEYLPFAIATSIKGALTTTGALETRPSNTNVMWVIFGG